MDGATALLRFSAHISVVGRRAGTGEAQAQVCVEVSVVQILVVVATIQMKILKTGEEKGSSVLVICRRSAGT